jgi:hypothetical protein
LKVPNWQIVLTAGFPSQSTFKKCLKKKEKKFKNKFIQVDHDWNTMRDAVQNYIGSLNWGYRVQLRDKKVNYINGFGKFIDQHKIQVQFFFLSLEVFFLLRKQSVFDALR